MNALKRFWVWLVSLFIKKPVFTSIYEEADLDPEKWVAAPCRPIVPSMMRTSPAVKLELDGSGIRQQIQGKIESKLDGRRG